MQLCVAAKMILRPKDYIIDTRYFFVLYLFLALKMYTFIFSVMADSNLGTISKY